ncbi:MAG: response regulator [Ardenticatenaceae bacterium]|nr:response regulator [Ardenticatenaceae bacterium]MCB8987784.1 response regulator [Ardenticatenaceae bacterium]
MSQDETLLHPTVPPEEFVEQVKQALEHLYDFTFLQRLPLAEALAPARPQANQTLGHHLRRELITAIEAVSPGPRSASLASDARLYNLLQLRYIEGITVQDAANRLGLSARQAHRSLRRGEESVAAILWSRRRPEAGKPAGESEEETAVSARELSSVAAEISLLEPHLEPLDVRGLLHEALRAVAPLAQQHELAFAVQMPAEPVVVSVDTAVARQIFVSLFSRILRLAAEEPPTLRLTVRQDQVTLALAYTPGQPGDTPIIDQVIDQLAARLGWVMRQERGVNGRQAIVVNFTGYSAVILVVDDNEGLVELLDRYLSGHDCRVITSTSGPEGLKLAQELLPDAIILDVMMPGASGWEILQTLRSQPQTATIPIIVCSVFNDPELAHSLGATRFHSKPITRDTILSTLRELEIVR